MESRRLVHAPLLRRRQVLQGIAEVREGRTFCLSLPLDVPGGSGLNPRRKPPRRFAVLRDGKSAGQQGFCWSYAVEDADLTDVINDDVVLMSLNARYGYLFYHDDQQLRWHTSTAFAHGWDAEMPADPDLVIAGILPDEIREAVEQAVARARQNGPQARVLVVRTFWQWAGGWEAWQAALAPYTLTYPYDSVEPVTIIERP